MNGQYSTDSPWIVDTDGKKITAIVNPDGTQSSLAYVGTNLPNLRAEETLYPYRVVMAGVNAFGVIGATMDGDTLLGVTDGTTRASGASQHALNGEPVRLQQSDFVQVTAGGNVIVSDLLIPTNEGKVIAYTGSSATCLLQAIQAGTDGSVIWCKKIGAFGIGGGVSPITGGGWPDTSKALWQCEFTGAIPVFDSTTVDPVFLPGPDFYFQRSDEGLATVQQTYFPVPRHFGVVDLNAISGGYVPQWITVGNAPPSAPANFTASALGGRPGVDLRYDNNEFVVIWKPYSYLNTGSGLDWRVYAGCLSASFAYPDDPVDGGVGFFFRASQANANWICVARFINTSTLAFVEYTQDSGVPINIVSPAWKNMKVITVEGSTPGSYPTVEWYIDGTLIHSLDVNTIASNIRSSLDAEPIFAMMGAYVAYDEDISQELACQLDYMHSLTTFTNPR